MAERLGRTVDELERTLTHRELIEWTAYDEHLAMEEIRRQNAATNAHWLERAKKGKV